MIKQKQLDELKRLHAGFLKFGEGSKPSLENHVMMALVSGEVPKIKPAAEISKTARKKIVIERYSRSLSFGDVFLSCNGYEGEMKIWSAYESRRLGCLSKYKKDAEKILLEAMAPEADASEISERLHSAADRAGLKGLTPPQFECRDTD